MKEVRLTKQEWIKVDRIKNQIADLRKIKNHLNEYEILAYRSFIDLSGNFDREHISIPISNPELLELIDKKIEYLKSTLNTSFGILG